MPYLAFAAASRKCSGIPICQQGLNALPIPPILTARRAISLSILSISRSNCGYRHETLVMTENSRPARQCYPNPFSAGRPPARVPRSRYIRRYPRSLDGSFQPIPGSDDTVCMGFTRNVLGAQVKPADRQAGLPTPARFPDWLVSHFHEMLRLSSLLGERANNGSAASTTGRAPRSSIGAGARLAPPPARRPGAETRPGPLPRGHS